MKVVRNIRSVVVLTLVVLGCAVLGAAIGGPRTPGDADSAAGHLSRSIEKRMSVLDSYIDKALAQDPYEWLDLKGLPEDMVVYRYCSDTLQSWCGQFPVFNDDLSSKVVFQNLTTQRNSIISPLKSVSDSVSCLNLGPKWYLVVSRGVEDCRVIGGLEIMTVENRAAFNGVNEKLPLPQKFSLSSLENDEGAPVYVGGRPQFKVCYDSLAKGTSADPLFIWLAIAIFVAGGFVYLTGGRTLKRGLVFIAVTLLITVIAFFWGRSASNSFSLFSPILYAGGPVLYSLGAVIIINLAIILISAALFLVRDDLGSKLKTRTSMWAVTIAVVAAVILLVAYTHNALSSIITNSNICLEFYKLTELSMFSAIVYASFISLLLSIPLLLQLLRPTLKSLFGWEFDSFSRTNRVFLSVAIAGCLLLVTGVHGFRTESSRLEVISNRLAIDRDISLEMRLKRAEGQIASDMIISSLSVFENTSGTILNRLTDLYLGRVNQEYSISVMVLNKLNSNPQARDYFEAKIAGGIPISENTHFMYVNNGSGSSYYAGVFIYQVDGQGYSQMLITVDGKNARNSKGYSGILGIAPPGAVTIPSGYSYARYDGLDLQYCNGGYSYVTRMDEKLGNQCYVQNLDHVHTDGYTHFVTRISDNETVIISRPTVGVFDYLIAFMVMGLVAFVLLSLLPLGNRTSEGTFEKNYYKTRIAAVLLISLVLTLVALALVSVLFVYSRNESNQRTLVVDKLNSIMSLVDPGVRKAYTTRELLAPELRSSIESAASITRSDITVFSPQGTMLFSTVPGLYDRMMLNTRIDGGAFNSIIRQHKRNLIQRERLGRKRFFCMYSPLIGAEGNIIGILCAPYTDSDYGFEADAVSHSVAVLAVFLFLLLLARFMTNRVLGRLFRPLGVLGRKINATNLDSLDLIEYNRDDEVQSLVQAYNRMVTELSENSKKLAQAERDKAWSGMARQVAHEIKNPLTPMKLQLQRVIRLKQKGDPQWQERFDEASKVLLDHIDILTDTANEFSTFAKLYSEEPTDINLDLLLQEEIAMFDSREEVEFEYLGLSDAHINGPKPQLTRVFVNLLSNAVQALEENGGGHVMVQLRNASAGDFYEVVVEDDGPGVGSENLDRLFTPNFTTKSSGSGLGLAISRSILERCGATISYSRSFTLGGACFTVRYPK